MSWKCVAEMERSWAEELFGGSLEWRWLFVEELVGGDGKVCLDGRADGFFFFVHPAYTVNAIGVGFVDSGTSLKAYLGVGGGGLTGEAVAEEEIRDEGQRGEGEEPEDTQRECGCRIDRFASGMFVHDK